MKKIFLFLAFLVSIPQTVFAVDVVNVILSPNTPGANQDVSMRLESFTTPLEISNIVWYKNGTPVGEGPGMTLLKGRTGNFGDSVTYDIVILTPEGKRIDKKIVLSPIEIDILWEADGYVPPFYRGKALPVTGGKIKVAAIPRFNSTQGDPSAYTYTWMIDRTKKVREGLGASSALVPSPKEGVRMNITANVSEYSGDKKGSNSIDILGMAPKIELYQHFPLLGLFSEKALRGHNLTSSDETVTLQAIPFFFTKEDRENGDLKLSWYVNGVSAPNTIDTERITITRTEDSTNFTVRTSVLNLESLLQEATTQGSVIFDAR